VRPTLLIAESDATLLNLFCWCCTRQGYEVATAEDGLHCLSKLRRSRHELLILDLELPWGGGEGVLAVMANDPNLAQIPVIVLTTTARSDLGQPPVVQVLRKPFSLNALLDGVRAALPRRQPHSSSERSAAVPPGAVR
jgi:DNA-binding response OmpR family regulator